MREKFLDLGAAIAMLFMIAPLVAFSAPVEIHVPAHKGTAEKIQADVASCADLACFHKFFTANQKKMSEALATVTDLAPEVALSQCKSKPTLLELYHCLNSKLHAGRTFDGGDPEDRAIASGLKDFWRAFMINSVYVKGCAEKLDKAACLSEGENLPAVLSGHFPAAAQSDGGETSPEEKRLRQTVDWGGLSHTADLDQYYQPYLRSCLDACTPGTGCGVSDPSFGDVCASVHKIVPITTKLGETGDRALDYVNRLRVEALRRYWAGTNAATGHFPVDFFKRHKECRRLQPTFDKASPADKPWPTVEGATNADLVELEAQAARFCVDDPDPTKGATFYVLVQMTTLTKPVLEDPDSPFGIVDACFRKATQMNSAQAKGLNLAIGAFCLGATFTKSIPLNLTCNIEVAVLAKLALDRAEREYDLCSDNGKVEVKDSVCGPDTAKMLLANLRYQRVISYLTIATAGLSTAVMARRDLSLTRLASAAALSKLNRIKTLIEANTNPKVIEVALTNVERIENSIVAVAGHGANHGGRFTTIADLLSTGQSFYSPGSAITPVTQAVDTAYDEINGAKK